MANEIVRMFGLQPGDCSGSYLTLQENLTNPKEFEVGYRPAGPVKVGAMQFEAPETVRLELGALSFTVTPALWERINAEVRGLIEHGRKVTKSASGSDVAKQVGL